MTSSYRIRVAALIALLLCLGTVRATVAETKTGSPATTAQKAATAIQRVSTAVDNGQVIASIEADGLLTYKTFSLHNPERVVMDLAGVTSQVAEKLIEVSSDKLARIRVGTTPESKGVRIVFDTTDRVAFQVWPTATGLRVVFSQFGKAQAKKADANKNMAAPPVAPPDSTGLVTGSGNDGKEQSKTEQVAKAEPKRDAGDGHAPASVPSVKGPAQRPAMARSAAAAARPSTPPPTSDTPADVQSAKLRFGDPGFVGDPISIDIAGVDINDILRFVSDNYGENFILDKSVTDVKVTVKVNDVPWNQVLESVFKANQLSSTREGLIVRVATLTALAVEQEQQRRIEEEKINNLPKVSKFFRLRYTRLSGGGALAGSTQALGGTGAGAGGATGLLGIIRKNLSKVGEVDSDPRTNQIIVTDIPQKIAAVEEIIKKLDVAEPQVEIEARVVLANRSFMRSIGNQLFLAATQSKGPSRTVPGLGAILETSPQTLQNTPIRTDRPGSGPNGGNLAGGGFIGPPATGALGGAGATVLSLTTGVIGTSLLSTAITASEQKGIAKTISTPRITVQNNTPGDITSGTQIAVQTEVNNTVTTTFVTAALRLNVTPQIVDEGNVLLRIVVENNSVDRSLRTTGGTPSITTQRAETLVLVPDGGTTILGGINLDSEDNVVQRTPGVSRIPYLGELFKKRSVDRNSQELLFFVTPRIYRPETLGVQSAPPSPAAQPAPEQTVGGER
jgi:type IV pilus assembly protein PilQ